MPPFLIRIQDIADILIMTFLLYQLYSWFRRTRAMQVLLGLGVITLIYFATRFLGLYMTSWILQELGTVLIMLIIVIFQAEIRQALYRFSLLRNFFDNRQTSQQNYFPEIAQTLFTLAEKRVGALVVIQREESLSDLMLNGVHLDCEITPQIFETVFFNGTPLHDGAVLINNGRIVAAACHLPLSTRSDIPQNLGTRHRAALGLSERSDSVALIVSEERGDVSLAVSGEFIKVATPGELLAHLNNLIVSEREKPTLTLRQRYFSNMLPKTALFILVTAFWALITSRQGHMTTINTPVRYHGLSQNLVTVNALPEELEVQLKSFSSLIPPPGKLDISADIDLSGAHEGQTIIRVKNSDFSLPTGMSISSTTPSSIKVTAEKKVHKTVPVKVYLRGSLSASLKGYEIVCSPSAIEIEGAAGQVSKIDYALTEEIDAALLVKNKEYRKNLLPPPKRVTILYDEPVTILVKHKKSAHP